MAAKTNIWNTLHWLHQKFCSLLTIRCHDRDNFHFPLNNCTEQQPDNIVTILFHCPLPPFMQFHCSIIPEHCSLSDQGTIPGKENSSPIREIHKDQTKGSYKGTSSGEDCGWIMTAQPGWKFSPGHQREAGALLPYPEASLSFLTNSGHIPSGGFHLV